MQNVSESLKALVKKCAEWAAKARQLLTPSESPLKRLQEKLRAVYLWLWGGVKNYQQRRGQGLQPKAEPSTIGKQDHT
jgi:hypothetical protein